MTHDFELNDQRLDETVNLFLEKPFQWLCHLAGTLLRLYIVTMTAQSNCSESVPAKIPQIHHQATWNGINHLKESGFGWAFEKN